MDPDPGGPKTCRIPNTLKHCLEDIDSCVGETVSSTNGPKLGLRLLDTLNILNSIYRGLQKCEKTLKKLKITLLSSSRGLDCAAITNCLCLMSGVSHFVYSVSVSKHIHTESLSIVLKTGCDTLSLKNFPP
jgi:hypothetical protein